jgi:hypothetical protein
MKRIAIYAVLLLFSGKSHIYAQKEFEYPSPIIGWDSLKAMIHYPVIMNRANIEGLVIVQLVVDSTGAIRDLTLNANAELFKNVVQTAIERTKWNPARFTNGRPTQYIYTFPIHFFLHKKIDDRIIIEEDYTPARITN